jgi:beta-aspartyl-peptidase (threonine type)
MNEPSLPTGPARGHWAQFSLKTVLSLMLALAAFLSGWSTAYRQAQEAEALARREDEMARKSEMQARAVAEQQALQSQMLLAQAQRQVSMPAAPDLTASTAAPLEDPVPAADAAVAIRTVLRLQAEAWNSGDLERFMEHYWKSDELTFSSGGQTTRGWQSTLDRCRERYPTIEQMGRLNFDQLEVHPLGDDSALVLGRWHLVRGDDLVGGNFSLVVRKIDGRWVIVHDHTSRSERPAAAASAGD